MVVGRCTENFAKTEHVISEICLPSQLAVTDRQTYGLPANIRQITSYGQLRQHLKTHLFRA